MAQWESQKLKYNSQTGKDIHETIVQVDKSGNFFARPLPGLTFDSDDVTHDFNAWGPSQNYKISEGTITGYQSNHKFAAVDNTASANYSTIWTAADTLSTILYPWDTSAGTLSVVSSSAEDASGQSGAVTMRVEGLDNSYNEITADFTLTGVSETSESSETFLVVNRAYVLTGDTNVGKIQIKNGSTIMGEIAAGMGQTLQAVYTIPAGKTGYLVDVQCTSSKNISTTATLFVREFGGVFRAQNQMKMFQNQINTTWEIPFRIPEKSNIDMRIKGASSNNVSADFDLFLVDN